jgi:hypothetical protein
MRNRTLQHHIIRQNTTDKVLARCGQIVPPEDKGIIAIENLNYNQTKFDANEDLIEYIDRS